uniref:Growth factor receptor-bound protein 10-like n=1 Tax=Sinocyclocheilus grahami TaxID=75366 RepID=A0A672RG76_SINGR
MALAGCPDYFLHHPNYQDNVDCTPSHRPSKLISSSFQQSSNRNSPNHPEDDVDLEALVNDMASLSSYESIYATCGTQHSDSTPLLHRNDGSGLHGNRVAPLPRAPSNKVTAPHSPTQKLRRSQPMHIQAVRRLQEEELQVRPASLPAIPNPFPELCSPSGSPVLSPGSLPQPSESHIIKVFSEDGVGKVVEVPANMTARDVCQFLVYKNHCLDDNCWSLVEHHSLLGLGKPAYVYIHFLHPYDLCAWHTTQSKRTRFLDNLMHPGLYYGLKPLNGSFGILLYQNYKSPHQRKAAISNFTTPVRSVSENSLVAMDFSGRTGRVIDNPVEAQSAAMEEGLTWRKRGQRINVLGSPSPIHPSPLSSVIHRTQLWFHGRIMREESHRMIMQQGQVDGLFLLRDSQSNPKAFVLTLCHHQKIKHFQILPFTDLIHLVEFYQLNRGILPCKLKHPCTMVAL